MALNAAMDGVSFTHRHEPANGLMGEHREREMADKVALAFAMLERIEWLESQQGVNLLSDDGGKWALSGDGMQPVPDADGFTETVGITSWVEPQNWKPTIAEAIDAYRAECAAEESEHAAGASQ